MARKKISRIELIKTTERLLLEQGYGGFNFSALSTLLTVWRSTLYDYYTAIYVFIFYYIHELMKNYTTELSTITAHENAKNQLIQLIELMIKYAHIHNILKMIPLLQSKSQAVVAMKEQFV